jgi:hypothetical protein
VSSAIKLLNLSFGAAATLASGRGLLLGWLSGPGCRWQGFVSGFRATMPFYLSAFLAVSPLRVGVYTVGLRPRAGVVACPLREGGVW